MREKIKKIISFLIVLAIISLTIFYSYRLFEGDIIFDIFFNVFKGPDQTYQKQKNIHLYDNESVSVNKVLTRVYYLIAKDKSDSEISNWEQIFEESLKRVSDFYELQFDFGMEIDFQIYEKLIFSEYETDFFSDLIANDLEQELEKPHSESETIKQIIQELENKIDEKDKWGLEIETENEAHIVNLFVLELGPNSFEIENKEILGLNDEKNNSLVLSFIFSDEKFKDFSESIIAHEIGHTFGMPDLYSYTGDEIKSAGLMGGGITRKIKSNYLEYQIKEKMIDY